MRGTATTASALLHLPVLPRIVPALGHVREPVLRVAVDHIEAQLAELRPHAQPAALVGAGQDCPEWLPPPAVCRTSRLGLGRTERKQTLPASGAPATRPCPTTSRHIPGPESERREPRSGIEESNPPPLPLAEFLDLLGLLSSTRVISFSAPRLAFRSSSSLAWIACVSRCSACWMNSVISQVASVAAPCQSNAGKHAGRPYNLIPPARLIHPLPHPV